MCTYAKKGAKPAAKQSALHCSKIPRRLTADVLPFTATPMDTCESIRCRNLQPKFWRFLARHFKAAKYALSSSALMCSSV